MTTPTVRLTPEECRNRWDAALRALKIAQDSGDSNSIYAARKALEHAADDLEKSEARG